MRGIGDIRGPASVVPTHEQVPAGPGRGSVNAGNCEVHGLGPRTLLRLRIAGSPSSTRGPAPLSTRSLPPAVRCRRLTLLRPSRSLSSALHSGLIVLQTLCPVPRVSKVTPFRSLDSLKEFAAFRSRPSGWRAAFLSPRRHAPKGSHTHYAASPVSF